MFIHIRYFYGDQIQEVEMGGRNEKLWGREMYRENYIQNRYIKSNIVCTNYKLKTGNIKNRADRIPHSARHTSLLHSPQQQPDLNPIEARGQILNIQQHGGVFILFFSTGATTHCGFVFCSLLAGLQPPRVRGFLITHNDAPLSVGLLWTSDQSVAEIST